MESSCHPDPPQLTAQSIDFSSVKFCFSLMTMCPTVPFFVAPCVAYAYDVGDIGLVYLYVLKYMDSFPIICGIVDGFLVRKRSRCSTLFVLMYYHLRPKSSRLKLPASRPKRLQG